MLKRQMSYVLLTSFAAVMVALLMLDDPAAKQAELAEVRATRQARRPFVLFPEITDRTQVDGLEVLDVTTGAGLLLLRNDDGLWYAPDIPDIQPEIAAESIDQPLVEDAAQAITMLATDQWYEATPENLALFGLAPNPNYRLRFRAHDAANRTYEARVDLGDTHPDNVAYYIYVASDPNQRVYLINRQIVDLILNMLTDSIESMPTSNSMSMMLDREVATPVP